MLPSGSVMLTGAVSDPLSAMDTYDLRFGSMGDSSWRVSSMDEATESRKPCSLRPRVSRVCTLANWLVEFSQLSAMVGMGGASWKLEAKLRVLATLSRLLTLRSRADLRMDSRAVLSMSSRAWSGK